MQRKGSAVWQGGLKDGAGTVSTHSGALYEMPYSFGTRFEESPGTNPEELIAAAHAGCFSMAFSAELAKANLKPEKIETTALLTLEKTETGFEITKIHLDMKAIVPGATEEAFQAAAHAAEVGCPVSKVLRAEITLDAKLEA